LQKRKIHDGIISAVILVFTAMGYFLSTVWLLVPAIVCVVMLQSAFSGFCPLYYTLDKLLPEK
jgi:hypothetical protein